MSLILFLVYWIGIPVAVFIAAKWVWRQKEASPVAKGFGILACVVALTGFLWLAVGETWLADQKVKELCAKDGGIKVYETVKLPAERFDEFGQFRVLPKLYMKPSDEFFWEDDSQFYEKNKNPEWVENHRDQSMEIIRSHYKLYRKLDNSLLGEAISYIRRGGGLPGPWHESSFICSGPTEQKSIESSIFLKAE